MWYVQSVVIIKNLVRIGWKEERLLEAESLINSDGIIVYLNNNKISFFGFGGRRDLSGIAMPEALSSLWCGWACLCSFFSSLSLFLSTFYVCIFFHSAFPLLFICFLSLIFFSLFFLCNLSLYFFLLFFTFFSLYLSSFFLLFPRVFSSIFSCSFFSSTFYTFSLVFYYFTTLIFIFYSPIYSY